MKKAIARKEIEGAQPSPPAPKKKSGRPCLTHVEVRRGDALRLRVAIADDAIAEAGDELGALIRKISPAAASHPAAPQAPEILISPRHDPDDDEYHEELRECLVDLFGSLCDASLADALEIVRDERARRAEGGN